MLVYKWDLFPNKNNICYSKKYNHLYSDMQDLFPINIIQIKNFKLKRYQKEFDEGASLHISCFEFNYDND